MKTKKLICILITLVMLAATAVLPTAVFAKIPASGQIGDNVFYTFDSATGAVNIYTQGEGTGAIWDYDNDNPEKISPFYYDWNIRSVTVGEGVTYIGAGLLEGCVYLTGVDGILSNVGSKAFDGCNTLPSVTFTDDGIVGDEAFESCYALATVNGTLSSVGENAFDSTPITSVTFTDEGVVGKQAFESCYALATVNGKLKSVGEAAFDSTPITSVTFTDDGVVGNSAFSCCDRLATVNGKLKSVGNNAFFWCTSLTSVTFADNATSIEAVAFFQAGNADTVLCFEGTIPPNIDSNAFRDAKCRKIVVPTQSKEEYCYMLPFEFADKIVGGYSIKATPSEEGCGTVEVSHPSIVPAGDTVTLIANPNKHYKFVSFKSNEVTVQLSGTPGVGTFTMPEKNVSVTAVFEFDAESLTVSSGEVFDLNGGETPALDVVVKKGGKIKDSTGGKGILIMESDALYGSNYTDQFPLYDEENGGYRFFDCEIGAGYIEDDNSIIGTTLKFNDAETEAIAKRILASDNSGVSLDITLSMTDESGVEHIQTAKAPQSIIKNYASDLTKPILMGLSGLKAGITISVNYRFANGLVISKEVSNATPYITLEADADKNYTVKVYGTGLDGVVIVALYNSENREELIDVKIQKVAEFSGQLQEDGSCVNAMLWKDLDSIEPLCDAVGKDLNITTP